MSSDNRTRKCPTSLRSKTHIWLSALSSLWKKLELGLQRLPLILTFGFWWHSSAAGEPDACRTLASQRRAGLNLWECQAGGCAVLIGFLSFARSTSAVTRRWAPTSRRTSAACARATTPTVAPWSWRSPRRLKRTVTWAASFVYCTLCALEKTRWCLLACY